MNPNFTAQQLTYLLNLIPANIYWHDIDCRMLGCNLSNLKSLGMTDYNQATGKIAYDLVPSAFRSLMDPVKEVDSYVKETGNEVILRETGLNPAGQETIYLSKKKPLLGTYNQVCGMIGISIDIGIVSSRSQQQIPLEKINELSYVVAPFD
jgi:hypothetical protein